LKTNKNPPNTVDDVLNQLQKYAPWLPAIFATLLLSKRLAKTATVKKSRTLQALLGNGWPLPALALLSFVALKDMRDTTTSQFENELKGYVGVSRHKEPDNPFIIVEVGDIEQKFTHIDRLAESLGAMSIAGIAIPDRAARQDRAFGSYDAARRAVLLGWADPYLLRVAEFLATRSLEQSMHELFPAKAGKPGNVTSITKTLDIAFNEDGTPKPGAEDFVRFMQSEIPQIKNPYDLFRDVTDNRDLFAHRDEAEDSTAFRLDFSPFQLARVCLKYRNQARR